MRQNFFSEQELMAMPLGKLNRLVLGDGIKDPEEELLVNKVMNSKRGYAPMQQMVTLRKDLDITTQKQEQEWEAELARRESSMRPAVPTQPQVEVKEPLYVGDNLPLDVKPAVDPQVVVPVDSVPQDVVVKIKTPRKPRVKKA